MNASLAGMGNVVVPPYIFWTIAAVIILHVAVGLLFSNRLREEHGATWSTLAPGGQKPGLRLLAFVWSSKPDKLGDPVLSAESWCMRFLAVAFIAAIVVMYHLTVPR